MDAKRAKRADGGVALPWEVLLHVLDFVAAPDLASFGATGKFASNANHDAMISTDRMERCWRLFPLWSQFSPSSLRDLAFAEWAAQNFVRRQGATWDSRPGHIALLAGKFHFGRTRTRGFWREVRALMAS